MGALHEQTSLVDGLRLPTKHSWSAGASFWRHRFSQSHPSLRGAASLMRAVEPGFCRRRSPRREPQWSGSTLPNLICKVPAIAARTKPALWPRHSTRSWGVDPKFIKFSFENG